MRPLVSAVFILCAVLRASAEPVLGEPQAFLDTYCLDCHDEEMRKGEVVLDIEGFKQGDPSTQALWERAMNAVTSGQMPPEKKTQPSREERNGMAGWIDQTLTKNSPIGGTLARRLSRTEYQHTIEALFEINNFELPNGFPTDRHTHGFDNLGEGLALSPPLLQAYAESANQIANLIFPPKRPAPAPVSRQATAEELVISYSSGKRVGDALRLGMKCDPIQRSCTWPSRIEVKVSGIYTIRIRLSQFCPTDSTSPMTVKALARDVASADSVSHRSLRELARISVKFETPEWFEFQAELYKGQTVVIHWSNAVLDSDRSDKDELREFFQARNAANPKYLAAWSAMIQDSKGQGFRGGLGWSRVRERLQSEALPQLTPKAETKLLNKITSNPVLYAETAVFDVFENGPALEIHELQVNGPDELANGPEEKLSQRRRDRLMNSGPTLEDSIKNFLTRAFRRPVSDEVLDVYTSIFESHRAQGRSDEIAMSLVIRNALISPRFLYRSLKDGPLDNYDLATRLSYFLTGAPPDEALRDAAENGELTNAKGLHDHAKRRLPTRANDPFIKSFTSQWLDTHKLEDIMPDPKFKLTPKDIQSAREEVERFFAEILRDNRPLTDFIDPDFTWASARIAKNIYGLTSGFNPKKSNVVHRVSLKRGGRHGGILGQSAVMMATANGVDTQPVLRGVWVLENVLGDPPPPPPQSVPALTPDTTGSETPRELLVAHTSDAACAGCHRKIDPLGLVLENFDPVGRWRDVWPDSNTPIDSATSLPDGSELASAVDLKQWLVENIDQFSQCLSEKLLTYATGRVPNYSERKEISKIVQQQRQTGGGFRDLVLALIQSETFRTK